MNTYRIEIDNPPHYIVLGKRKPRKYYLTAQIFYSGVHWAVRSKIVSLCKLAISHHFKNVKPMGKCSIKIVYYGGRSDTDNKTFFWMKIIKDHLKNSGKIPDDSPKYVREESDYYPGKQHRMVVEIDEK